ncbi:MAG TPA: response regulator [Cytophagaceae bacterium]|jgi:CheY-like chemotaxis protein|nr:response regulator [Cytophagaceae bacterium]
MKKKLNCVLLVDDDNVTNFLHSKVIEKAGVADRIEVKLNGQEAIDFLTHQNNTHEAIIPSLILLDINMPIMDGWEFLEAYRDQKMLANSKTNIVMLTTSSNPDDKQRAENIPFISAFKNKPLTLEMLDEILQEYF